VGTQPATTPIQTPSVHTLWWQPHAANISLLRVKVSAATSTCHAHSWITHSRHTTAPMPLAVASRASVCAASPAYVYNNAHLHVSISPIQDKHKQMPLFHTAWLLTHIKCHCCGIMACTYHAFVHTVTVHAHTAYATCLGVLQAARMDHTWHFLPALLLQHTSTYPYNAHSRELLQAAGMSAKPCSAHCCHSWVKDICKCWHMQFIQHCCTHILN
jgi:hypothetical protein